MKVLVIRFSSIGDIVLTTPVIRALATQCDAEVHLVTKKVFAPMMHANPYLKKVYTIEAHVSEVAGDLQSESYDYVVDLHHNLRSLQVKKATGGRSSSFPKLNIEKWLLVNFKIDRMPRIHVVDRYFRAAEPLGVKYDGEGLDFFIDPGDEVSIPGITGGGCSPGGYSVIVVGAGFSTKSLETEQIARLAMLIEGPVILVGGPEEREKGKALMNAGAGIYNLVGDLSIAASASVIKQSRCVVAGDTGMMHITCALDKPLVSVWGATVPLLGVTPFYPDSSVTPRYIVENEQLDCRPCSKMGYHKCPLQHFRCIRDLRMEQIASLVNNMP